ncbi:MULTISPECIES: tyrosine-type recombinase/integrase [unclassified Streptomyces]|uniref:tyrosine-type recombinase/integrase n=1 Tax=unclassified Streptomyces TaxID=2593676 RepID=UPI00336AEBB7
MPPWTSSPATWRRSDNPRRSWDPARKRLGPDQRFHDLRHTCITLLLDLGTPVHVVQQIAGHSDHGLTMKVYAHASLDEQRKARGRREGRLA